MSCGELLYLLLAFAYLIPGITQIGREGGYYYQLKKYHNFGIIFKNASYTIVIQLMLTMINSSSHILILN